MAEAWERELDAAIARDRGAKGAQRGRARAATGEKVPRVPVLENWAAALDRAIAADRGGGVVQAKRIEQGRAIGEAERRPSKGEVEAAEGRMRAAARRGERGVTVAEAAQQLRLGRSKHAGLGERLRAYNPVKRGLQAAATAGSVAPAALLAKAQGKPVRAREVVRKAASESTSYGEVLAALQPERATDPLRSVQGLALDLVLDPYVLIPATRPGRVLGPMGRLLKASEEVMGRVPGTGKVVRGAGELREVGQALGELGRGERRGIQGVTALYDRTSSVIARGAKKIARTQGKPQAVREVAQVGTAAVEEGAPRLSMDLAVARGVLKGAKETETAARKTVGAPAGYTGVYRHHFPLRKRGDLLSGRGLSPEERKAWEIAQVRDGAESQARALATALGEVGFAPTVEVARTGSVYVTLNEPRLKLRWSGHGRGGGWRTVHAKGEWEMGHGAMTQDTRRFASVFRALGVYGERNTGAGLRGAWRKGEARVVEATAQRAAAQSALDRLRQAIRSEGRVPVDRRGVTFALLQPGGKVTEGHVRDLLSALTERASLSGMALTPLDAERELLAYARSLGLDTGEMLRVAGQARGLGKYHEPRIVAAGIKDWPELQREQRAGGYLRRQYGRHLGGEEHREWLRANGMGDLADDLENAALNRPEVLGTRGRAPVRMWNPRARLPVWKQRTLQPVTDILARLQSQKVATARILPRMEMFQRMEADPRLVSKVKRPGWLFVEPLDAKMGRVERLRSAGRLEEAERLEREVRRVKEAGGWGALSGRYLHPQAYYALNPHRVRWGKGLKGMLREYEKWARSMLAPVLARERISPEGVGGFARLVFGKAKWLATVGNPIGQGFNKGGNLVDMHVGGAVPLIFAPLLDGWAAQEILRETRWAYNVMKQMPSLAETGSLADVQHTVATLRAQGVRDQRAAMKVIRAMEDAPERLWQLNEASAKLGVVKWHTMRGMPLQDAIAVAERAVRDYNDVPRWIEALRRTPLAPFPTYAYKTVGLFTNALLYHPQRLNLYTRLRQAVERLTPSDLREVEGAVLPEWEQANLPVRVPGEDRYGRAPYWRSGRALPWGSITNTDVVSGRSPFMIGPAISLSRNEDEFGQVIAREGASPRERRMAQAQYALESYMPATRLWFGARRAGRARRLLEALPEGAREKERIPSTLAEVVTRTHPLDVNRRLLGQRREIERADNELLRAAREHAKQHGYIGESGRLLPPVAWPEKDPDKEHYLREHQLNKERMEKLRSFKNVARNVVRAHARHKAPSRGG